MNPKEPQITREYNKDKPESTIQISQAVVKVGHTEIRIWHLLEHEVFAYVIKEFNRRHPNNNTPSNAKQKIIKFANQQFGLRVAFKSKEAFAKELVEKTRKMAARVGREKK